MHVRTEEDRDWTAVRAINTAAFETSAEADLVDALRATARPVISLVAEDEDAVVGHIMFSPVLLGEHTALKIMGLAPMAVALGHQRKGVGSALVRAGVAQCAEAGCDAVVVLGYSNYYPRFGFLPSVRYAIRSEYDVPDDVFMILELRNDSLRGTSGVVRYHELFANV